MNGRSLLKPAIFVIVIVVVFTWPSNYLMLAAILTAVIALLMILAVGVGLVEDALPTGVNAVKWGGLLLAIAYAVVLIFMWLYGF